MSPRIDMRVLRWFKRQFKSFDLLPQYVTAAGNQLQNILWGALLPFLVWGIWFIVANPPTWVNVTAVVAALFMAGYYVWRADHVRLMPKFEIREFYTQHTPTMDRNTGQSTGASMWVQLVPRCLTEAEVVDCQGHLQRVRKWSNANGWEETEINETLELFWSHSGDIPTPITLHPGIERRLDVFFIHTSNGVITPVVHPVPLRAIGVFNPQGNGPHVFRFDIKVTARDCPDVDLSLQVQITNDPFNPLMEIVEQPNEH